MTYTKTKHREYELRRYQTRMAEAKARLGGKCVSCGAKTDLQFHHIDPATKEFGIGTEWGRAADDFWLEVEKCELRCKACHDKHHKDEAHAKRKHGTWGMYSRAKCRCDECREFFNAYRRELRRRKAR